ncbi:MAG: cobaltochelatase subunit CobT, partial [Pseudomonadota bacterium]
MSTQSDNPADPFKKALAEATRTLANDAELNVSFSVDPPGMTNDSARLPQVTRRMTRDEVMLARGTADAYALRKRFHNPSTHARYTPEGAMAQELYEAMETARCEAVGARAMPGCAGNIDAKITSDAERLGYADVTSQSQAPLAAAAGYMVRELATGRDLPEGAENVLNLWRGFLEGQAGETLGTLEDVLADQAAFAKFARQVIDDLGYGDELGDDPDDSEEEEDEEAGQDEDEQEQDSQGGDEQSETESDEQAPEEDSDPTTDQAQAQLAADDAENTEMADEAQDMEGEPPADLPPPPISEADPNYTVFSTE